MIYVIRAFDLCSLLGVLWFQVLFFEVSGLTLRSLVYLEFIFEYDVGKYFNLILLHVIV